MKLRAVAALAAVVFVGPWVSANDRAIGQIRNAKERHEQRAVFERTVSELRAGEHLSGRSAPEARAIARSVVSNHALYRFGSLQKAPPKTWWQQVEEWLGERWKAIAKALFGRVHFARGVNVAVGDVLLVASMLTFLGLIVRLLMTYGRRALPAPQSLSLHGSGSAAALSARAAALAARGDFAAAVAALFAAVVLVLADRGVLEPDETRTVGELRRHVRRSAPGLAPAFDILARLLTQSVYAETPLTEIDWGDARTAYDRLRAPAERVHAA